MSNLEIHEWFLPQYGKNLWTKIVEPTGETHLPPWGEDIVGWDVSFMEKYVGQTVEVYHQNRLKASGILKFVGKDEKGIPYIDVGDLEKGEYKK